jgi:hypothetical protein
MHAGNRSFAFRAPPPGRILLVALAVVCVIGGSRIGVPVYRRYDAIRELARNGGRCSQKWTRSQWFWGVIPDLRPGTLVPVDMIEVGTWFGPFRDGDEGCALASELSDAVDLSIVNRTVSEAGIVSLLKLRELQNLSFTFCSGINDLNLAHISKMQTLRTLDLDYTEITDDGLKHLMGMKKLEWLSVKGTNTTAAGIAELRRALPQLSVSW